jgi:hypothetical protein
MRILVADAFPKERLEDFRALGLEGITSRRSPSPTFRPPPGRPASSSSGGSR